jgi:hypothetical protein
VLAGTVVISNDTTIDGSGHQVTIGGALCRYSRSFRVVLSP